MAERQPSRIAAEVGLAAAGLLLTACSSNENTQLDGPAGYAEAYRCDSSLYRPHEVTVNITDLNHDINNVPPQKIRVQLPNEEPVTKRARGDHAMFDIITKDVMQAYIQAKANGRWISCGNVGYYRHTGLDFN